MSAFCFPYEGRSANQTHAKSSYYIKPEGKEILGRKKKPISNSDIPQHAIETIARCILPDIIAYYESEEGQREFQEWLAKKEQSQEKEAA